MPHLETYQTLLSKPTELPAIGQQLREQAGIVSYNKPPTETHVQQRIKIK